MPTPPNTTLPSAPLKGNVGEIFSSIQGEGPLIGRRQIFVRMAGCSMTCSYCDTFGFSNPVETCRIEHPPASGCFDLIPNPISVKTVKEQIDRLRSPGLHSVSITGGEPLCQHEFVGALANECRSSGMKVYLETNGYSASRFGEIVDIIDFAAVDLKLQSHRACPDPHWPDLIENELACTRMSSEKGVYTIVKIVILSGTRTSEVEDVCTRLRDIDAFLVLQPASGMERPKSIELFRIQEEVSRYLGPDRVAVIPQAHKVMGVM